MFFLSCETYLEINQTMAPHELGPDEEQVFEKWKRPQSRKALSINTRYGLALLWPVMRRSICKISMPNLEVQPKTPP